ncbi:MAG: hypothetical protein MK179_21795 [Pirellulaceae bacterium]|nr:hypothetical protein [Pirellulaceae bacterium]
MGKQAVNPIRKGEILRLKEFRARADMGPHAWMMAKKQAAELGITLDLRHGRQCFVDVDRWLEFLERFTTQQRAAS